MPSELPRITLRLTEEDKEKLKYIANFNYRKVNDELTMLVQKHISSFESEYGEIKLNNSETN